MRQAGTMCWDTRGFLHGERLRRRAALGFHLLRRRRALTGLVVRLHLRELICHRNRLLSGGRLLRRRPWLLLLLLLRLVLPVAAAVASDGSYSAFDLPGRRFVSQPPEERWRLNIYIFIRINCSFKNKKFKKNKGKRDTQRVKCILTMHSGSARSHKHRK